MELKEDKNNSPDLKRSRAKFFRLNIAKKLLSGYLTLAAVILIISLFALSSLDRLNRIIKSLIVTDGPVIEATETMMDDLLAQETYAHRYSVLRSPEMLTLFWKRGEEFKSKIELIRRAPGMEGFPADHIVVMHNEYNNAVIEWVERSKGGTTETRYDAPIKEKHEAMIKILKDVYTKTKQDQNRKIILTSEIAADAFRVAATLCLSGILLGIFFTIIITRNISGPITKLSRATRRIAEGDFEYSSDIRNRDELGDLSKAFGEMAERLKKLEEMYLDASPLTRLPGGIAIENVLKKRLDSKKPIAFCVFDIDNFKAFNDRYGYANGSEVIKATARIIEKSVSSFGGSDDFIGHIGGDDFVVITTPGKYQAISNSVIKAFDDMVPSYYDEEVRTAGFFKGKTRQGHEVDFPLMTISIAVVNSETHQIRNPIQAGEIAAELKDYAKSLPGSKFVVDKRRK